MMKEEIIITIENIKEFEYIEKDLFKKLVKVYDRFKTYKVYKYLNGKMIFLYQESENRGSKLREWRYTTSC